ncbi:BTB/POZ domain-containing adapter for CUL3-mediated RhoA degradation protein 1 isoform X2 [Symphalangus syndactylus]|uniref:BTB/POZ domain-containing adapter for CUL3-mediated RhoA degradation protein 1 isoform X2 n=1 Tax=Symphalangus syndactylus TaxID=9590 RepID=UPI003003E857
MSAEASGPAAAAAPSLEAPKPSGLEPGPAAYGLKPLTPNSKYVKLNVGGSLHYTTLRTLTGQDTMLKAMFSGRAEVLTDAGGWVLIDRSGRHFGTILNYLRDGSVPLPESTRELGELLGEARYYLVQGLIEDCQLALQQKRETLSPLCLIPMVTSPREEQQLLASTSKPVVKLLHNRSNNKYSYTSTSDDNLLKNIELFDKLALRFHGRLLFLKDVLGDEICCWSFYGQGRKIAEVCCTSIVYATEKKQTKMRSCYIAQAGFELELLGSNDAPALASQYAGITVRRHHTQLISFPKHHLTAFIFYFIYLFIYFFEMGSHCHPGWSAVVQSQLTATSASYAQVILPPQPPE